ncbi:MFS transporter [Limoniibacter endophyticus]|uniref:MFS transporter n=1 Tax=Limoniibacter endophyticus TaxID=1565040 RepID=A0A8J3DIV8_9HYPH|nr:MFS transporter [Limoniibacter endophyticus]GHC75926.1 MFS transporter [Limoniibacter endophyticus]
MTTTTGDTNPLPPQVEPKAVPVKPGIVILAMAMGGFAIGTTEFASMSLLPYFANAYGIDEPRAGHAISAYALGVVIGSPIIAALAAKVSRRILLMALMAIFATANVASAVAPSYDLFVFFRFLSGTPHGAFFGVAALVAASLVPREKRGKAVASTMLGLTIATILGVPAATVVGEYIGWRWGFAIVAFFALLSVTMVGVFAPRDKPVEGASPLKELSALKSGQVWLTLATGAVGFGGMFAVYAYLTATLQQVTLANSFQISLVLAIFGVGATIGALVAGWAADKALVPSTYLVILWSIVALLLFPASVGNVWAVAGVVFLIGCGGGLSTLLQTRLMDVAEDAQTLAAALNHSAFNFANALGPFLSGLAIAAGYGLPSIGYVGAALAFGGLVIWAISVANDKRLVRRMQACEA